MKQTPKKSGSVVSRRDKWLARWRVSKREIFGPSRETWDEANADRAKGLAYWTTLEQENPIAPTLREWAFRQSASEYGESLAVSTLDTNETIRLVYLENSPIGNLPMTDIRPGHIQAFVNKLRKTSRRRKRTDGYTFTAERVSPAYEHRIFAYVSRLFTLYAQDTAFLSESLRLIADPTKQGIKLRPISPRAHVIPEPEHLVRIMNPSCFEDRAMLFTLGSGFRNSELRRAKWADLKDDVIFVRGTKTGGSAKAVALPAELVEIMSTWPRTSEFIFPGDDGKMIDRTTFSKRIADRQKALGMPAEMRPLQDLRTAFAVYLIEQRHAIGEDNMKLAQELLRHSKMSTTSTFYARARQSKQREALGGFLSGIREKAPAEQSIDEREELA